MRWVWWCWCGFLFLGNNKVDSERVLACMERVDSRESKGYIEKIEVVLDGDEEDKQVVKHRMVPRYSRVRI